MAQRDLAARLTRIQAAARSGDAAARRAWDVLIALVLRRDATDDDLGLDSLRLVLLIQEPAAEDPQFARAFQDWLSRYGTIAGSGEVHNTISGGSIHGPVIQGRDFHGSITFGDAHAARPPGPPFGDDDWDDETDENA
ncbi:hypothetical protein SAZ11_33970 [Streptomyces sp. FXJ1.4098]|uniref:hypothetical protein n=1 Tax=Streptomyces sp. NPDC020845 TaxID=3365096 RepID=UPI00299445AE|nr:hypothetical protein [Streptomyces sp. FXJ1.4098]